jgi:hypothetical protein
MKSPQPADQLYLVNGTGEHRVSCAGKVGFPFFGELILDCLEGTEIAMTQEHTFKAAELSLEAQTLAEAGAGGSRLDVASVRCH